jgi:aspartate/methionine/tyrosine aminotransferase
MAHQWIPFAVSTPLQEAVAVALELSEKNGYYEELRKFYQGKRDRLASILEKNGLRPVIPQGIIDDHVWALSNCPFF